jgi:hypothetical protein
MLDELEELEPTNEFGEVLAADGELERLMDSKSYLSGVGELKTRHDGPAFVEDDSVTKLIPSTLEEAERSHWELAKAGISFPSAVYWEGYCDGEHVTAMQQYRALGSEDSGFWDEFQDYRDEFRQIGETAAEAGIALDYKPENFGILDDELVYLDTSDGAAVKTGYEPSRAREEMGADLGRVVSDAPITRRTGWIEEIAQEFNGNLRQKYARP